ADLWRNADERQGSAHRKGRARCRACRRAGALARYQGVHRGDIIVHGIRDWLTAIKALPFHDLDEDGGVAGEGKPAVPTVLAATIVSCLSLSAVDGDTIKCNGQNMRIMGTASLRIRRRCPGNLPCQMPEGTNPWPTGQTAP